MTPVGFSYAIKLFTGKSLGEGKPLVAKTYYNVNLISSTVVAMLTIMLLYFGKESVIGAYTEQEAIRNLITSAWPIFLAFVFFDNA